MKSLKKYVLKITLSIISTIIILLFGCYAIEQFDKNLSNFLSLMILFWAFPFMYKLDSKAVETYHKILKIKQEFDVNKDKLKAIKELEEIEYYSLFHFFSDLFDQLKTVIFFMCIQTAVFIIDSGIAEEMGIVSAYLVFLFTVSIICFITWIFEYVCYGSFVIFGSVDNIKRKISDIIKNWI